MSEERKTVTETRDGRQLEVVVVRPNVTTAKAFADQFKSTRRPAVSRQRKLHNEPFAPVPLARAAKAAQATRSPALLVWVEIEYLAWKANDAPFSLPSAAAPGPRRQSESQGAHPARPGTRRPDHRRMAATAGSNCDPASLSPSGPVSQLGPRAVSQLGPTPPFFLFSLVVLRGIICGCNDLTAAYCPSVSLSGLPSRTGLPVLVTLRVSRAVRPSPRKIARDGGALGGKAK